MTLPAGYAIDPDLDLVLEREVDVPPHLVWAAWTDPKHLVHWFTPAPWQTPVAEIDLRPGGQFRTVMRGPEGQEFDNHGCYLEVVPNQRLVWTSTMTHGFRPNRRGNPCRRAACARPRCHGRRWPCTGCRPPWARSGSWPSCGTAPARRWGGSLRSWSRSTPAAGPEPPPGSSRYCRTPGPRVRASPCGTCRRDRGRPRPPGSSRGRG